MKTNLTKTFFALLLAMATTTNTLAAPKKGKTVKLRMIETTDVHGRFFPYDFVRQQPTEGSLARVSSYVDSLRNIYGDRLLLMDAGDVLQGQPVVTYYNYEKTDVPNVASGSIYGQS